MFTDDLYTKTLIEPLKSEANKLFIVSGYASPTMASRHIKDIIDYKKLNFEINLIVGMCPLDGIDRNTHKGFQDLTGNRNVHFECKYVYEKPAVHSKVYIWCKDNKPLLAFAGSANYTQPAFNKKERMEVLTYCNHDKAINYYTNVEKKSVQCNYNEIESHILITTKKRRLFSEEVGEIQEESKETNITTDNKTILSFLQRGGNVGRRSGLNWGQREGREPNQAYIPIPVEIARSGFFPTNKTHFIVETDDNKLLILRLEQQNNKAITTPLNNSEIGEYFRNRLGLANGQFVTKEDLERYGRTDVAFTKIDEETFYMDFSVEK